MTNDQRQIEENNSWNRLSQWDTWIDEQIREWLGDGDMSYHPKAGQKLQLHDEGDEFVPTEERLSRKIMKDNDVVPPWLSLAYTLRDRHDKIMKRLNQFVRDHRRRQREAIVAGSYVAQQKVDARWQDAVEKIKADIEAYNRELLNYNLQVPTQIGQMVPIHANDEIKKALMRYPL